MKKIDCSTLELLIKNHEQIDLIDIRAPEEFVASHIPGARSVPFAKLPTRKIFRRPKPQAERIYVISDDRGSASLAAAILRSGGWSDPLGFCAGSWPEQKNRMPVCNDSLLF